MKIGVLLIHRCSARSDPAGGGDAWSYRHSCRRSRRRIVSVKRAEFHVTGPRSLGALLVTADWKLMVFGSSGIVDRTSDLIYVRNIPLSGFMDIWSRYKMWLVLCP